MVLHVDVRARRAGDENGGEIVELLRRSRMIGLRRKVEIPTCHNRDGVLIHCTKKKVRNFGDTSQSIVLKIALNELAKTN
jgi:hypothetical protein